MQIRSIVNDIVDYSVLDSNLTDFYQPVQFTEKINNFSAGNYLKIMN